MLLNKTESASIIAHRSRVALVQITDPLNRVYKYMVSALNGHVSVSKKNMVNISRVKTKVSVH